MRTHAGPDSRMRSGRRWFQVAVAVGLALVLAGPSAAVGASRPAPRGLAVSVPPEPAPAPKGATQRIPIRVVNPGNQPVSVTISQRRVRLGDNGSVSIGAGADPIWGSRVTFTPSEVSLPARAYADVIISVRVPADIGSDLHFVGFLVSPVASAPGQVTVINQIGSFVTLDVPGPRQARLKVDLQLPSFHLGRQAQGRVRVANVGHSSVRFWGESDPTSWPAGSAPVQQRFDSSLAPVGTTRSLNVTARPAWPIGFVRVHGQIVYPSADRTSTKQQVFDARVLVIAPWVIVAAAALLVIVILMVADRFRRHRRRRAGRPEVPPSGLPRHRATAGHAG